MNNQIQLVSSSKARFSMMLSEARSNLVADRAEVKNMTEKLEAETEADATKKACCDKELAENNTKKDDETAVKALRW